MGFCENRVVLTNCVYFGIYGFFGGDLPLWTELRPRVYF
ncbi:hypothetical protein LEP1GSC172_0905 [Leptospira noguchii]|uniref:Uncharacterized protein n=1 Tax=Leptospira noguchii TaxID=28182 RepID=M6VIV3_9LEPT|nr:hypothetical protein LEP1GSC172_0905 [Leptospira noguchii]